MERLTREQLPFAWDLGIVIDEMKSGYAVVRIPRDKASLRPGGTVAGPVLMALGDYAMYAAVLSRAGPVELVLTTSFNINFLRPPRPGDVIARASLIKYGRRLVVGEVALYTAGDERMVAHVTSTYSIPPGAGAA